MDEKIRRLGELVKESGNIVFFGGAGVSTESGIPDFRGVDGLYRQKYEYPPEIILGHSFLSSKPAEFFQFYREKLLPGDAKPNAAHLRLAELEREGKLKAVITQNVDGLHQMAGSKNVLELHGSIHRACCAKCGRQHPSDAVNFGEGVPVCSCGGVIRPDIVLYEEHLDEEVLNAAARCIAKADVLIVGGTSLAVYPAASLVNYYEGEKLVLINNTETPYDSLANLVINERIGEVFAKI